MNKRNLITLVALGFAGLLFIVFVSENTLPERVALGGTYVNPLQISSSSAPEGYVLTIGSTSTVGWAAAIAGSFTTTTLNGLSSTAYTFSTSGNTGLTISGSGSTLTWNLATSSASSAGFLSSADWTLFNAKQASLGSAFVSSTSCGAGLTCSASTGAITLTNTVLNHWTLSGSQLFATSTGFNVGIGTTTPLEALSVAGHIGSYTLPSGATTTVSACGTSPAIRGTDTAAEVTVGGGIVTSCQVNFAKQYVTSPVCTLTINTTAVTGGVNSVTTSSVVYSFSATLGGGIIFYHCFGI